MTSLRPPTGARETGATDPLNQVLENEIATETFATYTRLTRRLEKCLAELQSRQAHSPGLEHDDEIDAAARALWHVVIQRDIMRLPATDQFLRELGMPREVRLRMGAVI